MRKLLLVSSSRTHGSGYLEHCREAILQRFAGVNRLVFVPFALADHDGYARTVAGAFESMGIQVESLHISPDPVATVQQADGLFTGGGNTFRLLKNLYDRELIHPIRDQIAQGVPYMGSSAGTNIACPSIRTTNDMPIVQPPDFAALNVIPFQINPHYLDADPDSVHQGETREQRLQEYLEENTVPVLGLREGSWLRIDSDECILEGQAGAILFRQGQPSQILACGDRLDFLLNG